MTTTMHTATTEFEKKDRCSDLPHRPRVLLGKMGLDGHDRGVKVIARALRDSGIHVIYSGLWQTPASLAVSARDEDVDCIAASMMSNSHLVLGPKLIEELGRVGRPDIPVLMGGILPAEDIAVLKAERAYLTRPERIEPLARAQGLAAATDKQFARDIPIVVGAVNN